MFGLQETLIRVLPLEPTRAQYRPGSAGEVDHLLAWRDTADGNDSNNINENGLAVDLAALLGLATGRRIALANEFPMEIGGVDGTLFLAAATAIDGELYGPASSETPARFETLARAVNASPERAALALGRAIRMRNAACCLAESDHSSAYGLLVGALEGLSREFGRPTSEWRDWDQAEGWDRFIGDVSLTDRQADALRKRLLDAAHIRLKRTFSDYAVSCLDTSFWIQPFWAYTPTIAVTDGQARLAPGEWTQVCPIEVLVPRDPSLLRQRAMRSYGARSGVFHRGQRLDHRWIMPLPGTERDPLSFAGLRRILDHALWSEAQRLAARSPALPDVKLLHPDTS